MTSRDFGRRTRQYWMIDGLPELFIGGYLLLISGLQAAVFLLPHNVMSFGLVLVPLLTLFMIPFSRWAVQRLKARITYPRTGYVEHQPQSRTQQLLGVIIGLLFGFGFVLWGAQVSFSAAWLPLLTGGVWTVVALGLGWYMRLARLYLLAAASLVFGVLGSALPGDVFMRAIFVLALIGLSLLVSGFYTFSVYRRTYPAGAASDDN